MSKYTLLFHNMNDVLNYSCQRDFVEAKIPFITCSVSKWTAEESPLIIVKFRCYFLREK